MNRLLARAMDEVVLRWTVRRAQLRRRTQWPDEALLSSLRAGTFPPLDFSDPGPPADVDLQAASASWLRSPGPDQTFRFPSSPTYARDHDRWVHGDLFLPRGEVRASVVVGPGAFIGAHYGTELRFYDRLCRAFASIGVAAALLDPPLHRRRTAPGEMSGHDLLHGDLFPYVRGVAQAVRDVRATLGWLGSSYGPTGFWGISLGGQIGAITAVEDPRLAFAVLVQPPLRRDRGLGSALTGVWREQLLESGVTQADIEAAMALLRVRGRPAGGPESIYLQAGRWDTVSSARGIEAVWAEWGKPRIDWYDHSHVSIFTMGDRLIAEGVAFAESRLAPRTA